MAADVEVTLEGGACIDNKGILRRARAHALYAHARARGAPCIARDMFRLWRVSAFAHPANDR
jgi:hypothetical protein